VSKGFALLEVLVALAILGTAGLAVVELAAQGTRAVTHALEVERRVADEDRLLRAYSLLNRRDLGQRVGLARVGPYAVRVERLDFALFRIALGAADGPVDLETILYRPEETDAE
jgi:prepilin-type N-terminal cleavage/methylation domain-containing protein